MGNTIYWIGGSSCSGKSTCARLLAKERHCILYNTDEYAFGKYMFGLPNIREYPAIENYRNQLCEGVESFIRRETDSSYQSFINYCYEVFPFLRRDILELSQQNTVIVEGAHILPELLSNDEKSIFLISAEEHQRTIWLKEMNQEIAGGNEYEINDYKKIIDKKAFENARIGLHQKIANHIREESIKAKKEYRVINGTMTICEVQGMIEEYFTVS